MYNKDRFRKSKALFVVLTLHVLFASHCFVQGSTTFFLSLHKSMSIEQSPIRLQNVTSNVTIYLNDTSAKVMVQNETMNLNVLELLRPNNDTLQIQLIAYNMININRLINCTLWFNDGETSIQIQISDGECSQAVGSLYDIVDGCKIAVTALTNSTGVSFVYIHLKAIVPNTSTYYLYEITFEIVD
ncbi:MAG: hypothetical protein QW840_00090 [Candidatus Bathyarchaeia archaeon]